MPSALAVYRVRPRAELIGWAIIAILTGTLVLSFQTPARHYLFPYAPYLQLSLQLGLFAFLLPWMRVRRCGGGSGFLVTGFLLLFIWSLLSAFWSEYPALVVQRVLMVMSSSLSILLLTFSDPNPIKTFVRLSKALALLGAGISLIGLLIYLLGRLELAEFDTEFAWIQVVAIGPIQIVQRVYGPFPYIRISSVFANPNTLASYLLVTLTLSIFCCFITRGRVLWVMLTLLQGAALLFTFSRAGIFATLLSCVLLFWFLPRSRTRRTLFVASFLLSVGLGSALVLGILQLPQSQRFSLDLNIRQIIWEYLWLRIREDPFLGVGFGVSYETLLKPTGLELAAHNLFLMLEVEIGLVGMSLFLSLWLLPVWQALRTLRFQSYVSRVTLASSLAIIIALFPHQIAESLLLRYGFHTLFWAYALALMVHLSWTTVSCHEKWALETSLCHHRS